MSLHHTIFADTESGPEVWIRVEGKGSFQNSVTLKEFARRMMEEGRRQFVVDLKKCVAMDSTFMGTLAGLAIRLRDAGGGDLWVVNRGERNAELLAGLGLDPLFSDKPLLGSHNGGCKEVAEQAADMAATRETIYEAHVNCVVANPQNADKFRDVIEHLKADVLKKDGK